MSWFEIISVVILGGLFWLWFDSTRVHEIAVERARSQCHVNEVQFLDDTVALANIKPVRDEDGRLILKRTYTFEYSDTGNNRKGAAKSRFRKAAFVAVLAVSMDLAAASDAATIRRSDCSCAWADEPAHPSDRHKGHAH
jgi:hypothetical protein